MLMLRSLVFSCALLACGAAYADTSAFTPGPVIAEYGPVADVPGAPAIAPGTTFKVLFSVSEAAEAGALNRRLESAARFLNMHVRAGVPRENIHLAIVAHGGAARDLTSTPREGEANANAGLIAALVANGVDIWVCGQTAAAMDIDQADLLPGVRMALSAMTANALLQQNGYTLNPG
jgi:intracellular sulfur oxidation DsrE/DsrF family protein